MEATYTRPKLAKSASMKVRGWVRFGFTLAVLIAVPVMLVLLFKTESSVRFNGVIDTGSANMGPTVASRLVSVAVKQGQQVKAGDILASFDSAERLLEESLNELKIRDLEQRLVNRRDELIETERRCRDLVRKAEVALETETMNQTRDEAQLKACDEALAKLEPLVAKHLVSEVELIELRTKAASLRNVIKRYRSMISTHKFALAGARDDLATASARPVAGDAEIDAALEATRAAFEKSEAIRKANPSVLRAISDGVVTGIFHRPGDIVLEGDPVLRLNSAEGVTFVTGMLPSGMQDAVHVGDSVWVTRQVITPGAMAPSVPATVEYVDEEIMDLFDTSGNAAKTTVRGRKVRIRIAGEAKDFVPGESVTISDEPLDGFGSIFRTGAGGTGK